MPIPPLTVLAQDQPGPASPRFLEQAVIVSVYDSGVLTVRLVTTGEEVDAYQHTDETLEAGNDVLVSQTETAWTVHGRA
jgi:hypothetical protein